MHSDNCFITLTYSDETQPASLQYRDFQLFLKKLRAQQFSSYGTKLRFYMCGEYGSKSKRAHFHACLFNVSFPDKIYYKKTELGDTLYVSSVLDKLWQFGFATIGALTLKSAAYCARYICGKVTGDLAEVHYGGREPEFNVMSRRPGIGSAWLQRFRSDVFPCDYVVSIDGHKDRVPRYYDRQNKRHDESELLRVKDDRCLRFQTPEKRADNTVPRLAAKETVQLAAVSQLSRQL